MKRQGDPIGWCAAASAVLLAALFLLPLASAPRRPTALFGREAAVDETEGAPLPSGVADGQRTLRVLEGEQVTEMDLGTYLLGVVRAEMPASFQQEALKAQAVAARTYTLYKVRTGGNHGDTADICTDPTCCQAYLPEDRARENWGDHAQENEAKIRQAVAGTDGEVILYGGEPVLAVFHSSSAGLTRPAGEVWRGDLPYLQAVTSPENGEVVPNYDSRLELPREELRQKLLAAFPEADLSGDMAGWLQDDVRDGAGSVSTVSVGGVTVKGSALRSALGLRSACVTWVTAAAGADYREILTHYYTGVTIGRMGESEISFTNPGET